MKHLLFLFALMYTGELHAQLSSDKTISVQLQQDTAYHYSVTTGNGNQQYGYNIYYYNRLLIHQQSIPAIAGIVGFINKAEAETVARFVISKLKNGIFPPSVSQLDLQNLGIHFNTADKTNSGRID